MSGYMCKYVLDWFYLLIYIYVPISTPYFTHIYSHSSSFFSLELSWFMCCFFFFSSFYFIVISVTRLRLLGPLMLLFAECGFFSSDFTFLIHSSSIAEQNIYTQRAFLIHDLTDVYSVPSWISFRTVRYNFFLIDYCCYFYSSLLS